MVCDTFWQADVVCVFECVCFFVVYVDGVVVCVCDEDV